MTLDKGKPTSVDEYINSFHESTQSKLREIRTCLKHAAPEATESLKWGQPAFIAEYILFVYAGFEHHVSLYPTWQAITAFKEKLTKYKTSDNTVQFPIDEPLPLDLITRIATFRVKESKQGIKWK